MVDPIAAWHHRRNATWCALGYIGVALAVSKGWTSPLDVRLARAAHTRASRRLLRASSASGILLAGEPSLVYAALLALVCVRRRRPSLGVAVIGALLATVAIEFSCKHLVRQPSMRRVIRIRPRAERTVVPHLPLAVRTPHSFPSGYAARLAYFGLLTAALIDIPQRKMVLLAAAIFIPAGGTLAATRVVSAAHWPSDVVAGLLLGGAAASGVLAAAGEDGAGVHG